MWYPGLTFTQSLQRPQLSSAIRHVRSATTAWSTPCTTPANDLNETIKGNTMCIKLPTAQYWFARHSTHVTVGSRLNTDHVTLCNHLAWRWGTTLFTGLQLAWRSASLCCGVSLRTAQRHQPARVSGRRMLCQQQTPVGFDRGLHERNGRSAANLCGYQQTVDTYSTRCSRGVGVDVPRQSCVSRA